MEKSKLVKANEKSPMQLSAGTRRLKKASLEATKKLRMA